MRLRGSPPEGTARERALRMRCSSGLALRREAVAGVAYIGFVTCRVSRLESLETVLLGQGLRIIDFLFSPLMLISFVKGENVHRRSFQRPSRQRYCGSHKPSSLGLGWAGWCTSLTERRTHCFSFRNSSHWQNDSPSPAAAFV